ncbi:MAG: carbohydrate-binding protein [Chitinophagaceae bacterium]
MGLPASGTWTIQPGNYSGTGTTTTLSGLTAGTYNFTVSVGGTCTSPASADVVVAAVPGAPTTPVVGTITQPTCATATGSVQFSGLPASGTWTINPGNHSGTGTTTTITGLTANTYNFTVTLAGCTSAPTDNVVINTAPETPTTPVVGTITQPSCEVATGSVQLSGLPSTGTWTIQPGNHTGTGTNTTISGLTAATYNFTVSNGICTSDPTTNVVITGGPGTTATPIVGTITQPGCATATGNVQLSGLPSIGTWTIQPGNHTGTGTSTTITGLTANTYNFTVTPEGECTSAATGNVVINAQPATPTTPTVGTITQPTCAIPTGSVQFSGLPSSGTWTINPGNYSGTGTTTTITGLAGNTYNFTVSNGSCTSAPTTNVIIDAAPAVTATPAVGTITQPTCTTATGSVQLNGLPASGTWTINPGSHTGTGTTTTITGLAANTYNFTVTIAGECTSAATVNVVINAQPETPVKPIVGTITQPTCAIPTGSVQLSGLPSTGTWTIQPGNYSGTGTTTTITGLAVNTYNFTVTNGSCISQPSVDVVIDAAPAAPATPTVGTIVQPTCEAPTGGSVQLSGLPSSGTWIVNPGNHSGTGTTTTITGLSAGTYNFTVTLAGCTSSPAGNAVLNAPLCNGQFIPGKIQAESYDAHQGGMYATSTSDAGGGQQVIGITNGSWMDYNVVVTQSGIYKVGFRVATPQLHTQFLIKMDGGVSRHDQHSKYR